MTSSVFDGTVFGSMFDWMRYERIEHGYVWVGIMEADPRTPGGPCLAWARDPENNLFYMRFTSQWVDLDWYPITEDEWRTQWPHSRVPPSVS